MATANDVLIKFPSGVVRGATPVEIPNAWWESNLVRWNNGILSPIGGWTEVGYSGGTIVGTIRAVHRWVAVDGISRIGILTESHIYVLEGTELIDITPTDFVPGGGSVGGYGDDVYNYGTYGTIRPTSNRVRTVGPWYSIDSWGQTLLVMSSWDGRLLQWDPSVVPRVKAAPVPTSPTSNRGFVVTQQKTVILFGTGGVFNRFGWCSIDNINDWNFASTTNTAGYFDVEPAGFMQGAVVTKMGIVFGTVVGTYFIQFTGLPNVYSYNLISRDISPITAASMVQASGQAYWYSDGSFWQTDGNLVIPMECTLLDWLLDTIDNQKAYIVMHGVNLSSYPEIYWFFPSVGQSECDRYIMYNYSDKTWAMGYMSRSAACASTIIDRPVMCNGTKIYFHESGNVYPDAAFLPFVKSSRIDLGQKDNIITINKFISDIQDPDNDLFVDFYGVFDRNDDRTPPLAVRAVNRSDGKYDVRITARDVYFQIIQPREETARWSFGSASLSYTNRGRR